MHDLAQRLIRLAREAASGWHMRPKNDPEQFSALAALMGQPDSTKRPAARLVLVDLSSAKRRPGASASRRRARIRPMQRCRRVIELARVVVR